MVQYMHSLAFSTLLGTMVAAVSVSTVYAQNPTGPEWWYRPMFSGEVVADAANPGSIHDNLTVATIGQAKWMALNALREMNVREPSAAETAGFSYISGYTNAEELHGWLVHLADRDMNQNLSTLTVGQLKALAAPIYQAFSRDAMFTPMAPDGIPISLTSLTDPDGNFPWSAHDHADNNSLATVGQLKYVFSFSLQNWDSDSDGLADRWEITYFPDLSTDGTTDYDGDGLTNAEELANNTLPNNADSDDDGTNDGSEIAAGTDPFTPDNAAVVIVLY